MRFTAITLAALTLTITACATTTSDDVATRDSDSTEPESTESVEDTTVPTEPASNTTAAATTTTTTTTTTVDEVAFEYDRDAVTDEVMMLAESQDLDLVRSCVYDKMTPEFASDFAVSVSPLQREVIDDCYDYVALVDQSLVPGEPGSDLFDRTCAAELFEDLGFVAYDARANSRERPAAFLVRCIDPDAFVALIPDLDAAQEACIRDELRNEEFIAAYEEPDADSGELFREVGRVCRGASTEEPVVVDGTELDQLVEGLRGQLPPGVEVESECLRSAFEDNGIDIATINEGGRLTEAYFGQLYDCFEPTEFAKIIVAQAEGRGVDPSSIDAQCIAELTEELDLGRLAAEAGDIPLGAFADCGVVIPD